LEISQAADSLPEYGRRKRGETWVLTRRGRPVAAVVPIDDEDYFSMRLANDPKFIEALEREAEPFASGFRHIKPEQIRSPSPNLRHGNRLSIRAGELRGAAPGRPVVPFPRQTRHRL
jgi:antitoxin (DNA-binding transcriptional repressor) of toxin-antitoxin stability system